MPQEFIRCRLAHFSDHSAIPEQAFEYIDDAIVVICDGKIESVMHAETAAANGIPEAQIVDRRPALMMPGFIDAHVHSPQINMIASYGAQLMDWLNNYTFPEELKFANAEHSLEQAHYFIDSLIANGTTTAFVFTTSHQHSTADIFNAAYDKNMRLIAGKVLMDRNAPEGLLDGKTGIDESRSLIKEFHNKGRLGYAVTPRFSGTSTRAQLTQAGQLLTETPDLWLQTHLSENKNEIEWTRSLFPEAKDYLNTYERHGLHGERSIYAHCVHLTGSEVRRIAEAGSTVAFCPSSNLFLGSGLLDLERLNRSDIPYCLATDVGGGTSLSMLRTLGDAYKINQLNDYSFSAYEAFYSSTLGAAKALKLDKFIGNIAPGKEADFIFINPSLDDTINRRINNTFSIEEELFVYMIMGDDRLIEETYINGKSVYQNPQQRGAKQH